MIVSYSLILAMPLNRPRCCLLAVFLLLSFPSSSLQAHPKVVQGTPPSWAKPLVMSTTEGAAQQGYDVTTLLVDRQINTVSNEVFFHTAYRINTASGVQTTSHLELMFDPDYQSLTLHSINVYRDGKSLEKLDLEKVQVFQQEKDLERFQYNGQLTALALLEDVRVGDIVEYAFTRTGRNPVFGAHFDDISAVSWNNPIEHFELRLLAPKFRQFRQRQLGSSPLTYSQSAMDGDLTEHAWSASSQKAAVYEQGAPAWHLFVPMLQVTDFGSWAEVVNWALPLYKIDAIEAPVLAKATELTGGITDPRRKAEVLLDFVQSEIRYLGIEIGPHSHAPEAPSRVLERRYGDCKDKSRLLCAMIKSVGIDAVPALTNSSRRQKTDEWLPSPYDFDHVIVRVTISGIDYWVDPTLSDQQGTLAVRNMPNYRLALPLKAGVTKLAEIHLPTMAESGLEVEEQFDITDVQQPAKLQVTYTYKGAYADSMRHYFRNTPIETVAKNSLNYIIKRYPQTTELAQPVWSDDKARDVITVDASYRITNLWKSTQGSPRLTAEFSPMVLYDYVSTPENRVRNSPYGLPYPFGIAHSTIVRLPKIWPVTDEYHLIKDSSFEGESKIVRRDKELTLFYRYTTLDDHVDAPRMTEYAEHLREIREQLGYSLYYNTEIAARNAQFRLSWYILGLVVTGTVWWIIAAVWLNRRDWGLWSPSPLLENSELSRLGGWLILVGLGVFARPIYQLVFVIKSATPFFDARKWETLTFAYKACISVEIFCQLGLLVVGILAISLFLQKRRLFPLVFVGTFFALLAFILADHIAIAFLSDDQANSLGKAAGAVAKIAIPAAIWIPYMYISRRAKATFTNESTHSMTPPAMPENEPEIAPSAQTDSDATQKTSWRL